MTSAERAEHVARRKVLYETLHPEASHGGDRSSRQFGDLKPDRFTKASAAATGQSERAIQRHAQRGERCF